MQNLLHDMKPQFKLFGWRILFQDSDCQINFWSSKDIMWQFVSGVNNKGSRGSKHVEIKYLVVKDKVNKRLIVYDHISFKAMMTDPLGKCLDPKVLIRI